MIVHRVRLPKATYCTYSFLDSLLKFSTSNMVRVSSRTCYLHASTRASNLFNAMETKFPL